MSHKNNSGLKIHYAWRVCAGCAILLFCTSGLSVNAFTIYQPYILSQNNFTNTQLSLLITFRNLFSLASIILTAFYYKKLSHRLGMTIAGFLITTAFVLFALAKSHIMYCIAASVMGMGHGLGTMVPVSIVINRWFIEKKNTALGICSAVTGLSAFGIPSLIARVIEAVGLKSCFLMEALVVCVLVILSSLLIRNTPEEVGTTSYGTKPTEAAVRTAGGLKPLDWVFIVPMLLLIGSELSVAYSYIAVLITGEGYSGSAAALAVSVSGASLMLGKIFYGRICDLLGCYRTNYIFGPLMVVGLALCCFIKKSPVILYAAMVFYSFFVAYQAVGLSSWVAELENSRNYDRTIRIFQLGYATGCLIFSTVPGILADKANGSYVPAFAMFGAFSVYILFAIQFVLFRHRKEKSENQEIKA